LCYDLTRGQYFINKKSVSEEERGLLRRLDKRQRGLELVFAIIRTSLDGQPETWEMIERYRAGALPALFNTKPLADPTQQKVLAEDLLSALKFIHTQPKTVNFSNAHGDMLEKEAFLFHGDISSAHILVEKEGERWRAILSKFKATGRFTACLGQEGFRSPNGVKFYTRVKVEKLDQPWVVQFNMEHGQKEDIWAMGLVILSILCGHKGEGLKNMMPKGLEEYGPPDISMMNISPLPCLERCLSRIKEPTATEVDAGVMDLTDGELAQDLEMLHKRYIDFHRKNSSETAKLWDLVKKMLKVDPAERISAGDALILLAK
jgi:serine/threonine protein kinase